MDSLYIGATGMHAQQLTIDVIANNLANVNTAGYKRNRIDFEDLLYRGVVRKNGLVGSPENQHQFGAGTAIAGTQKVFALGDVKKTEGQLDLAIRGAGLFQVTLPDGSSAYTRNGAFMINADGVLATTDGYTLSPSISIPADAKAVAVEANGRVLATVPGERQPIEVGQIQLANFMSPGALKPLGDSLYVASEGSGDASIGYPSENGLGAVAQGFLESSNVKLIEEMINLIMAQRAYELNSKVVQASDELLAISNNLRR